MIQQYIKQLPVWVIAALLLLGFSASGQPINNYTNDVNMAAPNAASLGKYTDVPVSYFTGVPQIGVPIYTVESGSLSLPISLSYHASGVKPNEIASWIGTNWSLNAGGIITRTVIGLADDTQYGYINKGHLLTGDPADAVEILSDKEPDIFSYNFNGYTGKFIIATENSTPKLYFIEATDLKGYITEFGTQYNILGFTFVTPNGEIYTFGYFNGTYAVEKTDMPGLTVTSSWHLMKIETFDQKFNIQFEYDLEKTSYIQLASCEYLNIQGNCTSTYGPTTQCSGDIASPEKRYRRSYVDNIRLKKITTSTGLTQVDFTPRTEARLDMGLPLSSSTPQGKALEKIVVTSDTYCKEWALSHTYFYDDNIPAMGTYEASDSRYHLKLDAVQEKSCDGQITIPATTFEYEGTNVSYTQGTQTINTKYLPFTGTRQIDHWGYFNGASANESAVLYAPTTSVTVAGTTYNQGGANRETNASTLSAGTLKKITYPTKGSTSYEYEANKVQSEASSGSTTLLSMNTCNAISGCCATNSVEQTISLTPEQISQGDIEWALSSKIPLQQGSGTPGDPGAYYCQTPPYQIVYKIEVYNLTTGGSTPFLTREANKIFTGGVYFDTIRQKVWELANFIPNNTYKFKLIVTRGYSTFTVKMPTLSTTDVTVGGLRIKKITVNDGISTTNDIVRTYEYPDATTATRTSGRLYNTPKYGYGKRFTSTCSNCSTDYIRIAATAITPLSSYQGYHVGYQRVIENHGTSSSVNGRKIYEFHTESASNPPSSIFTQVPGLPTVKHGKIASQSTQNSTGTILQNSTTIPDQDVHLTTLPLLAYRYIVVPICSSGSSQTVRITYPLRTVRYRVKSTTETIDGISTTFNMDYADAASARRIQPRYTTNTNSDGKTYKTEQKFAYDYDISSSVKTRLLQYNMIGLPYEVNQYVNDVQVSGSRTEYQLVTSSTSAYPSTYSWSTSGTLPYPRFIQNYEIGFGSNGSPTGTGSWVNQVEVETYYTNGLPKSRKTAGWADSELLEWSLGRLTKSTFKNYSKTYEYHSGTPLVATTTDIDGQKTWYDYDALMRLKLTSARPTTANDKSTAKVTTEYQYKYMDATTPRNYVRSITTFGAVTGSNLSTVENTQYMDGLGRQVQSLSKKASPLGSQFDLFEVTTYDNQGRIARQYTPYTANSQTGNFVSNPNLAVIPFTQYGYEASPLNRPVSVTPPGWFATTTSYGTNTTGSGSTFDNVISNLSNNTQYAAGQLYKKTVTDPNNNKTIIFTDKQGQVVLTRRTNQTGSNAANTYNVYDDKGRVTTVVPPGATISETNSVFAYTYDPSDNVLTKKAPGKGLENMRYDDRDLMTFYQDNVMSTTPRWIMTKYNAYGQPTSTGFWNGATPTANNSNVAYNELLTETTYDDATAIFRGRIKQTKVKILDGATTPKWLENNYTYDNHGRPATITGNNHINLSAGSETLTFNAYDWADNLLESTRAHKKDAASTLTIKDRYTFDHRGRQVNYYHKINTGAEVLVSNQKYNDRNFMVQKNLHGTAAGGFLQNVDYTYNQQGWISGINGMCLSGSSSAMVIAPPASANNFQISAVFSPGFSNPSTPSEKKWFSTEVSSTVTVDGIAKNLIQKDYYGLKSIGTDSVKWEKTNLIPTLTGLETAVAPNLAGFAVETNSDLSAFFLEMEKTTKEAMNTQGINGVQFEEVFTQIQSVVEQQITPVSAAAASVSMTASATVPTSSDLFSMGLFYETTNTTLGATSQKNGNISHMWSQVACNNPQYYGFQYDYLNRLTTANNAEFNTGTSAYINLNRYNEVNTYDARGNILTTNRRGLTATNTFGVIDNLTFTYVSTNKNRVNSISESGSYTRGFKTTTAVQLYTYDNNGNMSRDNHKKITTAYYYHNMVKTVTFDNGNTINWLYDASGAKLSKTTNASGNNVTHYIGGIEYKGTATSFAIEAIYHAEGRCTLQEGGIWRYEYNLRDHLGNTRVTFADLDNSGTVTTSEILQQNHYYPFGANIEGLSSTSTPNKYQYNGKEWNEDFGLNWNDYGARMYDPWVGRWWGVDFLADKYTNNTPYHYGINNPVLFIDPNGMEITFSGDGGYHATGQEAINAYWGFVQQEERSSLHAIKTDVSLVVTDEVVGTGYLYARDQSDQNIYFAVNIYRMTATYTKVDKEGNTSVVTENFEVLKYGVEMNKKTKEYEYAFFNNGRGQDISQTFSITTVDNGYEPYGGFNITGNYDLHPQARSIREIPDKRDSRLNYGCIGVCGAGDTGWGGLTKFLFGAAGLDYGNLPQIKRTPHLPELFDHINLSITVDPYTPPSGTPTPIYKN